MTEQEPTSNLYQCEITGRDGIYILEWPMLHINAKVERIRENTDHEVKGEVTVRSERPTNPGLLIQGRMILTSPANRKTMSRSLEERESEVDWGKVIEQLCFLSLNLVRSGTPEIEITGDADVEAQVKWLIEPLVQVGSPTLIYGSGAAGKSWLGQGFAVLADQGISALGFHVEPSPTLYLDWETEETEIGVRIAMIRRGMNIDTPSHIWYKKMTQGLSSDIETVRNIIIDRGIKFVVLDSLGSACMGEPESAEVVLRMFSALRSLNVSSFCIDHQNKEGTLFGSVYKYNASRMVFEVKNDQAEEESHLNVGLFNKKSNNSKRLQPIGIQYRFENNSIVFTRKDVRDTSLEEYMSVSDRIETLLIHNGPMVVKDIAEMLAKAESHIRKELSEGTRKKRFHSIVDGSGKATGKYAVAARESDGVPRQRL